MRYASNAQRVHWSVFIPSRKVKTSAPQQNQRFLTMSKADKIHVFLGLSFFLVAFYYIGDLEKILGYEAFRNPVTVKKKSFL